jgi:hypothetical protein
MSGAGLVYEGAIDCNALVNSVRDMPPFSLRRLMLATPAGPIAGKFVNTPKKLRSRRQARPVSSDH